MSHGQVNEKVISLLSALYIIAFKWNINFRKKVTEVQT